MSIRILLVGDFTKYEELRDLFESEGWQILADTPHLREGCGLIQTFKPDIVIANASNAEEDQAEALRIAQAFAYTSMILMCDQGGPQNVAKALAAGIKGYVLTNELPGALVSAVRDVARDHIYTSSAISRDLVETFRRSADLAKNTLTLRERQVLQLIAEGNSTKDLALLLGISVKTAESHRTHLMQKLDIHETATLVRYAFRHGIVAL